MTTHAPSDRPLTQTDRQTDRHSAGSFPCLCCGLVKSPDWLLSWLRGVLCTGHLETLERVYATHIHTRTHKNAVGQLSLLFSLMLAQDGIICVCGFVWYLSIPPQTDGVDHYTVMVCIPVVKRVCVCDCVCVCLSVSEMGRETERWRLLEQTEAQMVVSGRDRK